MNYMNLHATYYAVWQTDTILLRLNFESLIRLDRSIKVRSRAGARDFSSSLCVQTDSEAHPASFEMCTGGPFPGAKARPGRDADHSTPSSAEVLNE
jgi:hypothetical protein